MNSQLITDVSSKANLFNTYFSEQCNPIRNNSTIPTNMIFLTEKRISQLEFDTDDIEKIIKSLNPNKAHGFDGISIQMIQLCSAATFKPLYFLSKIVLSMQFFLMVGKGLMQYQSIKKKMINKLYQTTAQYLCSQFAQKSLKESFLILCINI